MNNYIYILPHKIKSGSDSKEQEKIITQKSYIIPDKGNFFEIMKRILRSIDGSRIADIYEAIKDKINKNNFLNIISFLKDNNLIYLSEELLKDGDIRLLHFLCQYTTSPEIYLSRMNNISFHLLAEGNNLSYMMEVLGDFGLKYSIYNKERLDKLDKENIVLACFDVADLNMLSCMADEIEGYKGLMWAFILFYDNSFLLSPILNRVNYVDFYSFKKQVNLEWLKDKGMAKNILVQRMGISEMILNVLTSVMKLGIQTSYDKAIIYDSVDKTFTTERIYYFPRDLYDNKLDVHRWDGEV